MSFFKNKTAFISGATSGIGRALAVALAREGANLVLTARRQQVLDEVKKECVGSPKVTTIVMDLGEYQDIPLILKKFEDEIKDVNFLFNNGGISQRSLTKKTDFEVYKKLMDINFLGTIQLSLRLLQVFESNGQGHFINISSMTGKFGVPLRSGYSASKMALHGFFESLRAEMASDALDLSITMVCPGFINTDIARNAISADGSKNDKNDNALAQGMSPEACAKEILIATKNKEEEVFVGGFKETRLANLVNRLFPSLFRRIISRSVPT